MKLNKEKFLKTEFGAELFAAIRALDYSVEEQSRVLRWKESEKYMDIQKDINILLAQWDIYQLALKQFYGVEYHFSRTGEHYGVCTKDYSDWLIKVYRQ